MKHLPNIRDLKRWVQDFRRDVIRMMRLKFIVMAMCILITVFLIMLGSINMIMNTVSQSQSMRLLKQIADSDRYNTLMEDDKDMQPPPVPSGMDDENTFPLSWGGGEEGRYDGRRPEMQPSEYHGTNAGEDDRRQPEWMNPDEQRPSENVPPQWETEVPPQTEQQTMELPVPTEAPADLHSEPPPAGTNPAAPAETQPAPKTTPNVPETVRPVTTEEAATSTTTTVRENNPPPDMPQNLPEPKDRRPDRWNVSVTIDHFALMADAEGHFLDIRNTENYSANEAAEILEGILAQDKTEGMYGWLQYCRAEKSYGTLLVVTDKTSDQGLLNNLFRTTVVIGIIMLLVLLGILIVVSRWITNPVHMAFVRQKQFVSDAGHELKTPIAVLTANADILQDEIGENKWLGYMQEQIGRMSQLVGDLLRLARMDNAAQEYTFADFDLSVAVAATTLPFESAAFEHHRNLEMDIQPEVFYNGSEQHIRQLCAIFIDNALKYSDENGIIKVTLLKRGEHSVLEFYNTGCEIAPEETEKIFERFYRGDKARNNKGKNGYGLGLAIAKSIMDVHKIKIHVTCEQGKWIRFLLTL